MARVVAALRRQTVLDATDKMVGLVRLARRGGFEHASGARASRLRNASAFLYQGDDLPRELPSGWGYRVNRKRVRRLLRMMGLEAMRPKSGALSAPTGRTRSSRR
jgi:hypothetical protein